jgi:hypothetical protein
VIARARLLLLGAPLALAALVGARALAGDAPATPPRPDVAGAIARGVAYLLKSQNADGSWGSPASNLWDIYAPAPGSQQAFQVASSALALSGLLEVGLEGPEVKAAIEKGRAWLIAHHAVGRPTLDVLYNTWAHAYALAAFARLLERETDAARRAEVAKAAAEAVDRLDRFQFAEGGWGYYNFDEKTKRPGPGSTSFTTATCLVALAAAKAQGVDVPRRLIPRALTDIEACAYPDGSFAYGHYLRYHPRVGVNQIKGSLARSPACLLGLHLWGRTVSPERAGKALADLEREGHFLQIARKYPYPHEAWYQNSGYFCFYGYYYATALADLAAPPAKAKHLAEIAARLVPLQERDGSWWDYQLFNFHKAYGTGYVLVSLARVARAGH